MSEDHTVPRTLHRDRAASAAPSLSIYPVSTTINICQEEGIRTPNQQIGQASTLEPRPQQLVLTLF